VTGRFPKALAAAGLLIGTVAAATYYRQGLTLSHYDSKAHLVVARRVLDSVTPEYSQIGAVWLPLPHLLNLLPVQIDVLYRTGASAVAVSVMSFGLACYAIARLILRATGSRAGATIGVAIFALEPDVLYLQSTPMTEPLLFGLTLVAISLVYDWVDHVVAQRAKAEPASPTRLAEAAEPRRRKLVTNARTKAGWVLVAACLTRYEAWVVTAALLSLAALALWRSGFSPIHACKETTHLAIYPVLTIVIFFFHSWFTTGAWFVTGGFFVPDNVAHDNVLKAMGAVVWGMRRLVGTPFVLMALAGLTAVLVRGVARREHSSSLVLLALAAFMALPAYAFYQGHPFRMRYIVAPTVGVTVCAGMAVGMLRGRWRHVAAIAAAAWLFVTAAPLDAHAPVVQEAQWDVPFSRSRKNVTACLMRDYHGEPILASMGSLAHYMQELSHEGIAIRNFIHEGNLPYWQEAIESPKGFAGWILVEERAEGGDMLAARTRESSSFLTGFTRICADGGVALYKANKMP
jgi:hypothetical protein